ncbi:MAG: hypothetical protein JEY94_17465 [Melioribacteraceae bacterium]|nr:hypothetical protein [Melioribacteraceae bacterium]
MRLYDKMRLVIKNLKDNKKSELKLHKKKNIDSFFLFDGIKILSYCSELGNLKKEIAYLRKSIDISKLLSEYLDNTAIEIEYFNTTVGHNVKWMIDQYYKDQKILDNYYKEELILKDLIEKDKDFVPYNIEEKMGLVYTDISITELKKENRHRELVFENIRNCEMYIKPELDLKIEIAKSNNGNGGNNIEKRTKWTGTKSEFARFVRAEFEDNPDKYPSLKRASDDIFDEYKFQDKKWTKELCYGMVRKN